jgi:hypothetical protein
MYRTCVIDNSTLVYLTKLRDLGIFTHLRSVFNNIYVPARILQEYQKMLPFEPERQWVIDQVSQPNYGFLAYCTKYDSVSLAILETTSGIDAGEAEAAAQHKSVNSQYILSDDAKFITAIRLADRHTRILNTLHIIALLDFNEIIFEPSTFLKTLHQYRPFNEKHLKVAYRDVMQILGIHVPRKTFYKKTSFRILFK